MSIKDEYTVIPIQYSHCKDWLLKKHYAHRIPPITHSLGLYDKCNTLQGVVTFGTSLCSQLQGICGDYKVTELNRLVINEGIDCPLSYFVSKSLSMLPKPMVIISYSDISQGHHGYIYQATNFLYTGIGSGGYGWAVKGMDGMHHTSIEDSVGRYEDRDTETKLEDLLKAKYGDKLYRAEQGQKHRYIYFVGDKKQKKDMATQLKYTILPYPKGDNKRYDASYEPQTQGMLI
jgi:hypothetical protein